MSKPDYDRTNNFIKLFDIPFSGLIGQDRGKIRRHTFELADRGSKRQRIGFQERRWSFSRRDFSSGWRRSVRFRRQWPEERGGNIIERFETPPCGRGEKEAKRQEGRDRSGPIKYNYFPIEWKLFGNERRAIDDIHTFIKRLSFFLSFSRFPTVSFPPPCLHLLPSICPRLRILFRPNTYFWDAIKRYDNVAHNNNKIDHIRIVTEYRWCMYMYVCVYM